MKKDDLTVGGADVSDNTKNYTDEHVKIDSRPGGIRNHTGVDLKKTSKSNILLTISGKLDKSQLLGSSAESGGFNLFTH